MRASWNQQIAERIDTLIAEQLHASGQPWAKLADGTVTCTSPARPVARARRSSTSSPDRTAWKSLLVREVLGPVTHLSFINADEIAERRWPGRAEEHAYDASAAAATARDQAIAARQVGSPRQHQRHLSSGPDQARHCGWPPHDGLPPAVLAEDLAVAQAVAQRRGRRPHRARRQGCVSAIVACGSSIAQVREIVDRATFYDNTGGSPTPADGGLRIAAGRSARLRGRRGRHRRSQPAEAPAEPRRGGA